jgi:hypothetical protein
VGFERRREGLWTVEAASNADDIEVIQPYLSP